MSNNPFYASLQLISWLIFTPSAWHKFVMQIDPHLPPDFAFAELKKAHWHSKIVQRLFFQTHFFCALLSSGIVAISLFLMKLPIEHILLSFCYSFLFSLVAGGLGSTLISVAFGLSLATFGTFLIGMVIGFAGKSLFTISDAIALAVTHTFTDGVNVVVSTTNLYSLHFILIGIFITSYVGSVTHHTIASPYRHPQHRQVGSVVIGVVISSVALYLISHFTSSSAHLVARMMESGTLFLLAYDGLIGGVLGVSLGLIWWLQTGRWRSACYIAISVTLATGFFTLLISQLHDVLIWGKVAEGLYSGIENAMLYICLFGFPYVVAKRIATTWAGIVAGILSCTGVYIAFAIFTKQNDWGFILPLATFALILGMTRTWWLPLISYPFLSAWNLLLYRADERQHTKKSSVLHWHSAFWDEHQHLPLFGLETYLVMVVERYPEEGKRALRQLSRGAQSWAVQEAQIELDARQLHAVKTVHTISDSYQKLKADEFDGPVSALVRSFSRVSRDVNAALAQESIYNQRLALNAIEERLDGLLRELTRSSESYANRFSPIAESWRKIINDYTKELIQAVESRQEISNPYIIGIPLTEHQEIFVGRSDVSEYIEQLLLDRRCPPLLLYGQRRTGKTSLLNNLGKLLPSTIVPLFVDFQGPTSLAKSYDGFLYNIARAMQTSAKRHRNIILPVLDRQALKDDPFTLFDEWLDSVEATFDSEQTALLTLDEFSALEHIFTQGKLHEDAVLGMFRHLIQHRPRFKILLAGSHTLDEFERWASYLINVQTVHLSYLQANEALELIEQPVKDFSLRYEYAAVQRVMEITRCHPALIQLLCSEIVTIKNRQHINERRLATIDDVEAAVAGALQHGRFFFADIANNQVSTQALHILQYMARKGEGVVVDTEVLRTQCEGDFNACIANLCQRELIEPLGNGYKFEVELIRRWFS